MVSLSHLEAALAVVDAQIKALLYDENLSLDEKNQKILPLQQENKVLKQAYKDLCYLKENSQGNQNGYKIGQCKEEEKEHK